MGDALALLWQGGGSDSGRSANFGSPSLGLACASWATRAMVVQLSTSPTPVVLNLAFDRRVLAFTALTMVTTAMAFGLVPAYPATRVAPMDALREHLARAPGPAALVAAGPAR